MPVMFSAMSYGSISYNAHESLARAATQLGIYYNTGEGGLHEDFYVYGPHTIVQVASGRFGVHKDYLEAGAAVEIKMGQGADACYVATAALLAMGCHLCRTCQSGKCNWGIATQRPELVKRLDPNEGSQRLVNLMTAWRHEIKS